VWDEKKTTSYDNFFAAAYQLYYTVVVTAGSGARHETRGPRIIVVAAVEKWKRIKRLLSHTDAP